MLKVIPQVSFSASVWHKQGVSIFISSNAHIKFGFRNWISQGIHMAQQLFFFFSIIFHCFHKFDRAMSYSLRHFKLTHFEFWVSGSQIGLRALGVEHPSYLLTRASQGHEVRLVKWAHIEQVTILRECQWLPTIIPGY